MTLSASRLIRALACAAPLLLFLAFGIACSAETTEDARPASAERRCSTAPNASAYACVPTTAREGVPTKIELGEPCGNACDFELTRTCSVEVVGTEIRLAVQRTACELPDDPDRTCNAACVATTVPCTLPALPRGSYTVTYDAATSRGDAPRRRTMDLVVVENGLIGCVLGSRPPLRRRDFDTRCSTAADCVAVTLEDVAGPCVDCACPNDAIARVDEDRYVRARAVGREQCELSEGTACAPCPAAEVACDDAGECVLR